MIIFHNFGIIKNHIHGILFFIISLISAVALLGTPLRLPPPVFLPSIVAIILSMSQFETLHWALPNVFTFDVVFQYHTEVVQNHNQYILFFSKKHTLLDTYAYIFLFALEH